MYRRLFSAVAVVSSILFLATCALWLRSYWRADEISRIEGSTGSSVGTACGSAMYFTEWLYIYPRTKPEWQWDAHADPAARKQAMDDIERRTAADFGNGFRFLGFAFRGGGSL